MRQFFAFFWLCVKEAFPGNAAAANDWQWMVANPVWQIVGTGVGSLLGKFATPETWVGIFLGGLFGFVVTWMIAFTLKLCKAPATLFYREKEHNADLQKRIVEIEKVDRQDLQRMLAGCYFDDTFMYSADGMLCRQYKNGFELERLKDGFDFIAARAPRNSFARLRFQFMNQRQETTNYYRDGYGKETAIKNMYERQTIYLDEQARFGLKLVCHESFKISEQASLTIMAESWTK